MAILVPEVFGRRLHSPAEAKIATRFRNELVDSATLLHSVGLVRHLRKRWAEADFVLVCERGVFCIEVKGGRVGRTDGVWTFTDHTGHVDTKYEGPFDQAGGAAGALFGWLGDNGIRRTDGTRFEVGYAVMTPDCVLEASGPDIETELLNDRRDMGDPLSEFIDRVGAYWQARSGYERLSLDEIRAVTNAVRPDFAATVTRTLVADIVSEQLIRHADDQLEVLQGLAENQRLLVKGAAGTGKSMLAVAEARRLASEGKRVLLVCHTRALAQGLAEAAGPGVETTTASALMFRLVDEAGLEARLPDATQDVIFDTFLPELAIEALEHRTPSIRFDAMVVDEGQDLLRGECANFLDRVIDRGFENGNWRLFLDPNQNIFGPVRADSMALLESGAPGRFTLSENCRNTQQIAEFSSLLSGAAIQARTTVSGPDVRMCERWSDPWVKRSVDQVDLLLSEGMRCEDITVLTHTRRQTAAAIESAPDLLSEHPSRSRVRATTIGAFKGLDSTSVVLTGLASLDDPRRRQAAYIGATRARVQLAVVLPRSAEESFGRRVRDYAASKVRQV